jgi:hypothetical protein
LYHSWIQFPFCHVWLRCTETKTFFPAFLSATSQRIALNRCVFWSSLFLFSKSKSLYDWQSVSQSVSMSWYQGPLWGLRPDITSCRNVAVWNLLLVSVGCPLWREDGSAICTVISQWSESRRIGNQTLLSHLRLRQPGGPGSRIYIPQEQGGPVIPLGTGFPLRRLLRFAGLRWRYSNAPPTWRPRWIPGRLISFRLPENPIDGSPYA